jgi:hypothetical protein
MPEGNSDQIVSSMVCVQDNQRDLESATEHLSEYLERDISAENLVDIKQKVQDKYRSVDFSLVICCQNFYEQSMAVIRIRRIRKFLELLDPDP